MSAAYQMSPEEGWVALLDKKLKAIAPNATVINSSLVGDTTATGLSRLPLLLQLHQPDIVILELGGNDGLRGLPIKTIESNLNKMIVLCLKAKAIVILVGMRLPPNYGASYIQAFERIYTELGTQHDILLVPFLLDKVALEPQLMLNDGMHPKAKAQPIILNNVWPVVVPLIVHTS